jgi:hypothetical protein
MPKQGKKLVLVLIGWQGSRRKMGKMWEMWEMWEMWKMYSTETVPKGQRIFHSTRAKKAGGRGRRARVYCNYHGRPHACKDCPFW